MFSKKTNLMLISNSCGTNEITVSINKDTIYDLFAKLFAKERSSLLILIAEAKNMLTIKPNSEKMKNVLKTIKRETDIFEKNFKKLQDGGVKYFKENSKLLSENKNFSKLDDTTLLLVAEIHLTSTPYYFPPSSISIPYIRIRSKLGDANRYLRNEEIVNYAPSEIKLLVGQSNILSKMLKFEDAMIRLQKAFLACQYDDDLKDKIRLIASDTIYKIIMQNKKGLALRYAAFWGDYINLQKMEQKETSIKKYINQCDKYGNTPLHFLVKSNIYKMLKDKGKIAQWLIKHGANPKLKNNKQEKPEDYLTLLLKKKK